MKKQLENIQLKDTIKVKMSKQILDKISLLCKEISRVEWSGILLYSVKGTIRHPKNMLVILQDIIPMHKGTAGYTEYQMNEPKRDSSGYEDRMIDYFNEHPIALEEDWKMGHIHSHHSMRVYFSGTDMEELEDNSPSYNFYLSLIVNNYMDFVAKIAFIASIEEEITADYKALDENGEEYIMQTSKLKVKKEKMFIYDCDIQSPKVKVPSVDTTFMKNLNAIIEKAEQKVYQVGSKIGFNRSKLQNPFYNTPTQQRSFQQVTPKPNLFSDRDLFEGNTIEIEDFLVRLFLFNESENTLLTTTLDEALDEVSMFERELGVQTIVQDVLNQYTETYQKVFPEENDEEDFIDFTREIISTLENYEQIYNFLPSVIVALKSLIKNLKTDGAAV